jgi:serine/threonine protein kinase
VKPEEVTQVGRWRVVRFLGAGGFSWVFEVLDEDLGRRCALKMLRSEAGKGEQYRRFRREAELLASFNDPHIVTIFDRGLDDRTGCHFYVMELFTGMDLRKVIDEEGPLHWGRAANLFVGVLQGLGLLHSHEPDRIIHRDIKPSNIQFTAAGQAKLFDFGIASIQSAAVPMKFDETRSIPGEARLTEFNAFIGTVRYASPEQIKLKPTGPASDVFSVGLCFFEALTGTHPYEDQPGITTGGHTFESVLEFYALAVRDHRQFRLDYKGKEVPPAIRAIIAKALDLDPTKRFRDAVDMRAALLRALTEGASPQRRGHGFRPPLWLLGGVLGFALLGVAAAYLLRTVSRSVSVKSESSAERGPSDGRVPAPTSSQISDRDAALEVRRRVDSTPPSAFSPVDLSEFRGVLDSAEAAWGESAWDPADTAYRNASRLGEILLARAAEKFHADLSLAKESAVLAGAQQSAPQEFRHAEALANEALQESTKRGARLEEAIAAYEAAGNAAIRALAEAHRVEKSASERVKRACTKPTSASTESCERSQQLLARGEDDLRSKNAAAAGEAFVQAEHALNSLPAPVLTLDRVDIADLRVGVGRTIQARAKSADGTHVALKFELTDPTGKRETSTGDALSFKPSIPGDYQLLVTATDVRGSSVAKTEILRVEGNSLGSLEPKSVEASPPQQGAGSSPSRRVLDEYSQAIKSCDRETLATLVPRAVAQFIGESCDRYAYLDATIAYVSEEPGAKGTTVHFTQAIHGITQDGRTEVIGEGRMKASFVPVGDGWRVLELSHEP